MNTTPDAESSAQDAAQPERRRVTRAASVPATEQPAAEPQEPGEEQPQPAPRKRTTRKSTAKATSSAAASEQPAGPATQEQAAGEDTADRAATTEQDPAAKAPAARKPARKASAAARKPEDKASVAEQEAAEKAPAAEQEPVEKESAEKEPAPRRRTTRRRATAPTTIAAAAEDAPAESAIPAAEPVQPDAPAAEDAAGETTAEPAPRKRRTTRRATKATSAPEASDAATDGATAETPAATSSAPADAAGPAEEAAAPAEQTAPAEPTAPARRTRRSRTVKAEAPEQAETAEAPEQVESAEAPEQAGSAEDGAAAAPAKRKPARRRSAAKAAAVAVEETAAPAAVEETTPGAEGDAPAADSAPAAAVEAGAGEPEATVLDRAPAEPAVEETPAEEPAPTRRRSSRKARTTEQKIDVLAEFSAALAPVEPVADDADEDEEEQEVRLPATALLFQAPDPTRVRRRVRAEAGPPRARTADPAPEPEPQATSTAQPEAASTTTDEESEGAETTAEGAESSGEGGQRRRRRRGGRGRRNRGGAGREESENSEENGDAEGGAEQTAQPAKGAVEDADHDDDTDGEDGTNGDDDANGDSGDGESDDETTSRRRRRRRRSRSAEDGTANSREGRAARDEITALKGSTRLEAKRQRRREGRDAGRRRTTITEAEFLARRESVDRSMIVRERDGRTQIAVLEDGVLVEHYVARETHTSMVGNVYLGRVQNVLPSMEAAFVDLGKGRNAVLYAGEVNWDAAGMQGQPRRIEQALSSGDTVLVQVTKDPIGHKGARLTSQITLAGRYLVLVPSGAMTGISRKLPENERARLKKLLKEIVPEGAGVIVRTAAEGATEEQLRADVERLTSKWEDIQAKAKSTKSAPVLLKGEPELAVRVVRDVFNEDFGALVVSGDGAWETISGYVRELSPDLVDRMHHWTHSADVFAEYRIDAQLAKGMARKVYLPSGGSLVIDRTEAMTVVDVNTGKFTGTGGTVEAAGTKNNPEAAEEIDRQLPLREIGGIIVIDFIDMVLESNRDLVLRRLVECLGRDRTRHQVAEVTSL